MKKILSVLLSFMLLLFCGCQKHDIPSSNYIVYGWDRIENKDKVYRRYDKYGNDFKNYRIFYELNNEPISAQYYSNGKNCGETELITYKGDIENNFISQAEHWYDFFEPSIYGNVNNPRFNYLDDFNNVEKLTICNEDKEYILPEELSKEIWSTISMFENNNFNTESEEWKKSDSEFWVYLYIKDINAAVYIGILCYNTEGVLCISNTNYTMLHHLPSDWQDLNYNQFSQLT